MELSLDTAKRKSVEVFPTKINFKQFTKSFACETNLLYGL